MGSFVSHAAPVADTICEMGESISKFHLGERCHHIEVGADDLKVSAPAVKFLIFLRSSVLAVECTFGLADEIEPFFALRNEGPVRVIRADRRIDFEPAREFYE